VDLGNYWLDITPDSFPYIDIDTDGFASGTIYATFTLRTKHVTDVSISLPRAAGGTATVDYPYGPPGSVTTLTASPASGYAFSSWTVVDDGGGYLDSSTDNPVDFTFGYDNATVLPTFTQIVPALSQITVSASVGGSATASVASGMPGTIVSLSASATNGFAFLSWIVTDAGGGSISSTTENPAAFTLGNADATVTATFAGNPTITTLKNIEGGSVMANPTSGNSGSSTTVTAYSRLVTPSCPGS